MGLREILLPPGQGSFEVADDYVEGLRLVVDGGALLPQWSLFGKGHAVLTGAVVGVSTLGPGFAVTGSNFPRGRSSDNTVDRPLAEIPAGSDWTAQFVVENIGIGATNSGFFRNNNAAGTFLIQNGSGRRPWIRVNSTNILQPGSGPQWVTGQTLNIIARCRNASTVNVWWDGEQQHSASHSVTQEAVTGSNAIHRLMVQGASDEASTGVMVACRIWSRYLDDDLTKALAWSHEALYRPLAIYLPISAPSAPTLLAASAINITSTSCRPRVTFTR